MTQIDHFIGPYGFLSNFAVCDVTIPLREDSDHLLHCRTVEHAFQALKTLDPGRRQWVASSPTPGVAKRRGRSVDLRGDWDEVKEDLMLGLLRQKFAPGTPFADDLLDTGDAELIEGNHWGDRYWGQVRGVGRNVLGQLLMQVREELETANVAG